jgi:hypothetical protein
MNWWLTVAHFFGTRNNDGNSSGYLFWSGVGSDLSELAMIGFLYAFLRKHNCHSRGCWRIGRHPVEGTGFVVCRKHHPDGRPDAEEIRRRYHLYLGARPGQG